MTEKLIITHELPELIHAPLRIIKKRYIDTGMKYGWKATNDAKYDQGHWNKQILNNSRRAPFGQNNMPMIDSHPEVKLIWKVIQKIIGSHRDLYRCYINGYTYGTDGYAHRDDGWIKEVYGADALSETAIVYLNDKWHIDWAGETVLFDDNEEIRCSVLPKFGRLFMFDSDFLHAARPVSRACQHLRSVLVFKTIDPKINDSRVKFILDKTEDHKHSGRTFFEHLFNTMKILEQRKNNSDDLCIAGLYHSIYGTEFYNFDDPSINRDKISDIIGSYAEFLVWVFCSTTDRINKFINNAGNYDDNVRTDLIRLELANLIEQGASRQDIDRLSVALRQQEDVDQVI